jgi:mannose/cellobiose epimerase-like protein (N-acyl-D-glucosamine 2-epimerase family)
MGRNLPTRLKDIPYFIDDAHASRHQGFIIFVAMRSLFVRQTLRHLMTEKDESRAPDLSAVISIHSGLSSWLLDRALPLWDEHGVDRRSGGYFENISCRGPQAGLEVSGDVRRGRVVARQIYAFDVGQRLGWRSHASSPVDHGGDYLFAHLHRGDGRFHTSLDESTLEPRAPFSLYEQAFYLFALARLNATFGERYPAAATAARCLARLRSSVGKSIGGFEESNPPSLPLKSNPHMHLLEAALAWIEVTDGPRQQPWIALATEIVGLCLTRFRDPSTGAIREYFDFQWAALAGDDGRVLEPGHQFEWAWLLMRWSESPHSTVAVRAACASAIEQLLHVGERWGVDRVRGIAINEMWDDMTLKDATAKLWPQTERVKAWCAVLDRARTPAEADRACRQIGLAAQGMAKFLRTDAPGLWHEVCSPEGAFVVGPSRASSLYHVVCAIDTLRKTLSNHLGSAVYCSRSYLAG